MDRVVDFGYFKSLLETFLHEEHPSRSGDTRMIDSRSRSALDTYRELYDKGATHQMALEQACLELKDGFGFSLFCFLYDLVSDNYTEIPDETRRDFCLSILPECQRVLESLDYEDMDDGDAYYFFEEKMEEIIQKHINPADTHCAPLHRL